MELTEREAGKFLNASESTVTRWIKQRGNCARGERGPGGQTP